MKHFILMNIFNILSLIMIVSACNETSPKVKVISKIVINDSAVFNEYHQKVSAFMDAALLSKGFNGSILISKNDTIVCEKYSGHVDLRKKDPITETTSMQLASASKTFTAVAILKMIEDHKLSINDSLTKFFPGFPYPGITVRMLLCHRSGLPNYLYFISKNIWDQKKYVTNQDVLNLLFTQKPARYFPPDTRFRYCNTNFVLLALIIEKMSGESFPEYMKRFFFEPLQMDHTYVYTLADSAFSTPSFNYNNRFWANDFLELTYGDKNIYSTPRDLFKWSKALFSGKIISNAMLDSAFTLQSNTHKSLRKQMPFIRNYGLGFRILLMQDGRKIVYHFGRWHGFNAAFARLLNENVTIIILGNKFHRSIYNVARLSYDLFGNYFHRAGDDEEESEGKSPFK